METTRMIEQYLEGSLSKEEKLAFEARAKSDKNLRNLISLHKEINESIADKDLLDLKTRLDKVSAEYFMSKDIPDTKRTRIVGISRYNRLLRIAAILILVAAAGIVLKYVLTGKAINDQLYNDYYTRYEADVIMRSSDSDKSSLDHALLLYSDRNYNAAIKVLDGILEQDQHNYYAWFYRGLSCLEANSPAEAVRSFQSIPASWDSPYREHRNWYLALALLRNGNIKAASDAFKQISSENGYYAKKSKKVARKING